MNLWCSMTAYKIPTTLCPECGYLQKHSTGITQKPTPCSGDVSLCFNCGAANVFTDDLGVRRPTPEESKSFESDVALQVARTYIQVRGPIPDEKAGRA